MRAKEEKYGDLILVIPAYNEAENIEKVVDELILKFPMYSYVVVTDGPTDGTDLICKKRGYNTVELQKNQGLTKCFKRGMEYAEENGFKYVVQFDGDGQHRPEYIAAMYEKAKEGYDIVLGSRFAGHFGKDADMGIKKSPRATGFSCYFGKDADMGILRMLGSLVIRLAIRAKTGTDITDPTCGMRLYSENIIKEFAAENSELSPEPDTIAYFLKKGVKIAEVPVKINDRAAGKSYLSAGRAAEYMKRILCSILKSR